MGGTTDQAFLEAPVPKSGRSGDVEIEHENIDPEIVDNATPHPNQTNLYSG